MDDDEFFERIPEFPDYSVSNYGRIFNNNAEVFMSISNTTHGHAKISLVNDTGRHTRSVAVLVAQAFVAAPDLMCDQVVVLNGDMNDLRASNLMWRPRWFAWRYTRQLKEYIPPHLSSLKVTNKNTGVEYDSIYHLATTEGLLLNDIWRSTYTGASVYPTHHTFEITERV